MRRDQYVARIKQTRHALVAHRAREDHAPRRDLSLELLLNLNVQTPTSHQQEPDPLVRRNQLDRFRKFLNTVPRSKRSDKTRDDLILPNTKFPPDFRTANTRSKALDINAIRINNDLLRRDTTRLQVAAFDIRDDKNTRRRVKVQSLVSLQQIEAADPVPVPPHPNFRAVVFEKQRPLRAIRRHDAGPAKPRVSLINEIRISLFDQRHRAACEHEVVVNVEECACVAAGLRRNHRETFVRNIHPGDEIVADDLHVSAERFETFNDAFDVTRSAARLRAWTGRRAQINNSQTLSRRDLARHVSESQCHFFESL